MEKAGLLVVETECNPAALAGVRALRAAGYRPWVASTRRRSYAARSRAVEGTVVVPQPDRAPDRFRACLAEAAARLGVAAVLPADETALLALAGAAEDFAVPVGAPPAAVVRRATDKVELEQLAADAGAQTPPTLSFARDELDRAMGEVPYPAIVKPVRSKTRLPDGRLVHAHAQRVESPAALAAVLASVPGDRWLIQPFVDGVLEAVSGVAWQGAIVCAVHQRAVRTYPPDCGPSAYAETVPPDPGLELVVGRLLEELGWSGLFQVQFLSGTAGRFLIDLNVRMYGSLALAVGAGMNLPAVWADLVLGRTPEPQRYRVGATYRSEERDLFALLHAIASRDWRTIAHGLVPRTGTAHAIFSLRDPLPVLTSAARFRRSRTADAG